MFFYGFCDMGGRGKGWGAVSHFIMPFKLLFLGELAADSWLLTLINLLTLAFSGLSSTKRGGFKKA